MKILYCFHSLSTHGGVEKILSVKANYLVEKFGYEVFIITYNQQNKNSFFKFNTKIKIIDLGMGEFLGENKFNFIERRFRYYKYRRNFKKKISKIINDIVPDICISLGGSEFYILNEVHDKSIKLAEYHVTMGAFDYANKNLVNYKKLLTRLSFFNFVKNIKKYEKFIVLTEGDKNEWKKYSSNVINIPNPSTVDNYNKINVSRLSERIAIAVGRFEPEKGFDKLIFIWSKVIKKYPDWVLILKGSGSQESLYRALISKYNLINNVILEEPSLNMDEFYTKGSIYLMASEFEGFSLVLLEAMSYGLPIISYNCKHGPAELISNEFNGYLISQEDEDAFLTKIEMLIEDKNLRMSMGENSKTKSKEFQIDLIMKKWKTLFESYK